MEQFHLGSLKSAYLEFFPWVRRSTGKRFCLKESLKIYKNTKDLKINPHSNLLSVLSLKNLAKNILFFGIQLTYDLISDFSIRLYTHMVHISGLKDENTIFLSPLSRITVFTIWCQRVSMLQQSKTFTWSTKRFISIWLSVSSFPSFICWPYFTCRIV